MQARFTVQVLALEAQVLRGVPLDRCVFTQAAAPGRRGTAPDDVAVAVGHAVRQAVQFRVIPEDIRVLTVAVDACQRFIAVFGVDILHRRVRVTVAGFIHHLQAGQGILRAFRFPGIASPNLFLRTAAWRVVAVFGSGVFRVALNSDLADAVLVVVAEALRHGAACRGARSCARSRHIPGSSRRDFAASGAVIWWEEEMNQAWQMPFSPGSLYWRRLSAILNTKLTCLLHIVRLSQPTNRGS